MAGLGVYLLIAARTPVEPVLVGVLGGILTALTGALAAVGGYWLAQDASAKKTSQALADQASALARPHRLRPLRRPQATVWEVQSKPRAS